MSHIAHFALAIVVVAIPPCWCAAIVKASAFAMLFNYWLSKYCWPTFSCIRKRVWAS